MFYAILNTDKVCTGLSNDNDVINFYDCIEIESYDIDYLGRKYEGGKWSKDKYFLEPESIPEPDPPTEQELIQAELLLNQTQILINQEQQDTVLAELLLNQIGGI